MTLKNFNFRLFIGLLFLWVFQIGTSTGMSFILYIFPYSLIYLAILLFSLIYSGILKRKLNKVSVKTPNKLLYFILIISLFILLFNVGDCGNPFYIDSRQSGNFIQRIFLQKNLGNGSCKENLPNLIPYEIIMSGVILNFVLILILVSISLGKARKSSLK